MTTLQNTRKLIKHHKPSLFNLTFGQVIIMDLFVGAGLLAILYAVALNSYESAIAKARLVEVFSHISSDKLALQEQLALTGGGFPTLQAEATHPAGKTSGWGEGKVVSEKHHSRGLEYSVIQIENSLIARGVLGEDAKTPFFLTYTPAVISNGVPGSMMWLCGNRKPPSGWARLPGPSGTDLPAKYLYSICRDNKEP